MRHAKSSWDNASISDHERPLNARGRRSAPIVAERLLAAGIRPVRVISSDSTRTRETWDEMLSTFPHLEPRFLNSLYLGGLGEIVQALDEATDTDHTILLLGHNPGFSMSVSWFTGSHVMLKTAYAAVIQIESDNWVSALGRTDWQLIAVITPKGPSEA